MTRSPAPTSATRHAWRQAAGMRSVVCGRSRCGAFFRSRTDIAHTVRLLDLPDQAIELIDAGVLTKGHGKALLTEPDHGRRRILARRAADQGWSVRTLEAEIRRRTGAPRERAPNPDHAAAAERLEDAIN